MVTCPVCRREVPGHQLVCPHCGVTLGVQQTVPSLVPTTLPPNSGKLSLVYWRIGLLFSLLGIAVEWHAIFLSSYPIRAQLLTGMGMAVFGLTLFAKARGWHPGWGIVALLPPIAPIFVLIGILFAKPFRSRIEKFAGIAAVIFIGILSALIIPSYWQFQALARQSEARSNLDNIYSAEQAFYGKHKRYGTFDEIGFTVSDSVHRYTYRINVSEKPGTIIPAGNGQATPDNTVISAGFSPTGFTATATANIDNDQTLDQWHVNDSKQSSRQADVDDMMY